MALAIGMSTYVSGGYLNPVRWDLHEAGPGGTVGALVDSYSRPGPHAQVYTFSFTSGIKDINYIIMFYDVPGGVGVGNLVKSHETTPTTSTVTGDEDIELIVDGGQSYDPLGGTSSVVIPQLHGKDFWLLQRSVGELLRVRTPEYAWDDTTNTLSLAGGFTFNPADTYFAKVRAKFVVNPSGSYGAGSGPYKDVIFTDVNLTLTGVDIGKMVIVDGSTPVITITLPDIANFSTKIPLFIESVGTTHKYVVIKAATGEVIKAIGANSNTFILGRATRASVINLGGTLFGFTDDLDIKRRGQMEWGYTLGINRLWADGTEYLVADYPGIKKAIDLMAGGLVVTYAQWASSAVVSGATVYPYKGKFALSNDSLNFKVPDWRGFAARGLKTSDGSSDAGRTTQGSGGYQHYSVGDHNHYMFSTSAGGVATAAITPYSSGGNFGYSIQGGGLSVPNAFLTGPGGTGETTGKNYGLIPQIII